MAAAVSSAVKSVIRRGLSDNTGTTGANSNALTLNETSNANDQYRLRVTAGPSMDLDNQQVVFVNSAQSCAFENEFMKVKVQVRIKDFQGIPSTCPANDVAYFSHPLHTSDRYSIAFSFIPKRTLPAKSAVWGNEFTHPVRDRLPPGFKTAFNIVKSLIDPGLECDAYADKPWLFGPALGCLFTLWVGEKPGEPRLEGIVEEGGEGSGLEVRRNAGMPDGAKERRKWALDEENRARFVFEEGREYRADFFNPYLDFSNFAVCLPGFSVGVIKYVDDKTHKLRYVFKDKETGQVYFAVVFTLLFGKEVESALAKE